MTLFAYVKWSVSTVAQGNLKISVLVAKRSLSCSTFASSFLIHLHFLTYRRFTICLLQNMDSCVFNEKGICWFHHRNCILVLPAVSEMCLRFHVTTQKLTSTQWHSYVSYQFHLYSFIYEFAWIAFLPLPPSSHSSHNYLTRAARRKQLPVCYYLWLSRLWVGCVAWYTFVKHGRCFSTWGQILKVR